MLLGVRRIFYLHWVLDTEKIFTNSFSLSGHLFTFLIESLENTKDFSLNEIPLKLLSLMSYLSHLASGKEIEIFFLRVLLFYHLYSSPWSFWRNFCIVYETREWLYSLLYIYIFVYMCVRVCVMVRFYWIWKQFSSLVKLTQKWVSMRLTEVRSWGPWSNKQLNTLMDNVFSVG